ncbi:hypothetical protein LINPERPRIM_LOCUS38167 [Linum perenne]
MNKGFTSHDAFAEYRFTFLSNAYECDQIKFTTKLLKLVYQQNNRTNDCPDIASFAMKYPETMRLQNKHASELWVCSWIKNECRFPFNDYGT